MRGDTDELEDEKYIEIIDEIKAVEKRSYDQIKSSSMFDNEIQIIEQILNHSNLDEINKSIDKFKFNIENYCFYQRLWHWN